jgi:hypothetical protein
LLSCTAQCVVVETGRSAIMERRYYLGSGMATDTNGAIRRGGVQLQIKFNEMEIYE